jgi:serine/threonine protein kinase/tetratricopeptide (TPR) repeat protein
MERIGEGGMGVVYVAEQTTPVRRRVALKLVKPGMDTKQVIARFEAERQALALMDHPNIAKVYDGGTTASGRPYFVMELVRGIPITDYCDDQQLSIPERLELFVLVCRAVQHAHQKGIIHRDLKPSNILVTLHDSVPVPKVIDFGVVKATGVSLTDRTVYTAFTQLVGTPLYMSPEQVEMSGLDVDTRSDIYSLGVLLYELLTGTTPFDRETLRQAAFDEMRRIIREEEPPRPSTRLSSLGDTVSNLSARRKADPKRLGSSLRGELDWIVMKALEKDRRRRYETANDFASDVMRYLTDQPVEACPPSTWYRFSKSARRNRAAILTTALVMLALAVGTAVSAWQAVVAARARRETSRALATARAEAGKASAINDFLIRDLLGQADPSKNAVSQKITLREVVDRAADRVGERFRNRPLVEATLRCTLGDVYWCLGAYDQCRQQYSVAHALYERELGPDAPETAIALAGVGEAWRRLEEFAKAESLLRQATDTLIQVRGAEHPDTLRAMGSLAAVNMLTGRLEEARPFYQEILEVSRRIFGPEDSRTLDFMGSVAEFLIGDGRPREAEQLAAQALEASLRVRGENHFHSHWNMVVLGQSYQAQGKLMEAERWFTRAVEGYRRVLGEEHPYILTTLQYLASVCRAQGKMSDAERLYTECLRGYRRIGVEDRMTRRALEELAEVYQAQGKLPEGEALWPEYLALQWRTRPDGPSRLNNIAWSLATGPFRDFEPARAVELARKAVEKVPEVSHCWNTLGVAYYRAGDWAGAIDALDKAESLAPGQHLAVNGFFRAMAHYQIGQKDEARRWRDKAIAWMAKHRSKDGELLRFRAEAEALIQLEPQMPKGEEGVAR